MPISVFVSVPKPFTVEQEHLVTEITEILRGRGLEPRTLGVSEYDNEVPLAAVRRMLLESNGVLAIGLRRYHVEHGASRPGHADERGLHEAWFSSPWPHLEAAMGFQLGLPIMVQRERGVFEDGIFDPKVVGRLVIEVDAKDADRFLSSQQWRQPLASWEHDVRTVARRRGEPPKLY